MDQRKDRHADRLDLGIDSDPIPELDTVLTDHPILTLAVAHLPILAAFVGSLPDQAVFWGHQGLAVAIASEEELHESDPDVEAAGDSLYYLTGMFRPARALVHLAPALVFVGAEASLLRRIFAACPEGTLGWRLSHHSGSGQQQDWQPTVVESPYAQQTG